MSPLDFLVSTTNLERWMLRVCVFLQRKMSPGTGSVGKLSFLVAIHCWKLLSAQFVVLAVFVGISPSASLASSWSPAAAKRPLEIWGLGSTGTVLSILGRGWGSLWTVVLSVMGKGRGSGELFGGWNSSSCDSVVAKSAFPGKPVYEHMRRQKGSTGQANVSY